MIVKNESKIIERCLNPTKSIVDFVSICDMGSTDDTPDIIKNWTEKITYLVLCIINLLKILDIIEV